MINIVQLEEIQHMLLLVPNLINKFEKNESGFVSEVKDWLFRTEQILTNNRLAIASDVAVLRGELISSERGATPPDLNFRGRTSIRKIKNATAARVLLKANEMISSVIKDPVTQIIEGEKIAQQLVTLARRKGLIKAKPNTGSHTDTVKKIWNIIANDPDLGPAATHLAGLVGTQDALILIDRMMPDLR